MTVLVNHDYGGADALAYQTADGRGIDRADIKVFRKEDWLAGNRSARFLVGRAITNNKGRWESAAVLPPGDYVVLFGKPGKFGPDVKEIAVTE